MTEVFLHDGVGRRDLTEESRLMVTAISAEVKAFIVQNFMFGQPTELAPDQSFLQTGVIDSTGLLELVSFLEERYGISVDDRDLTPENLDSLANVSRYVASKGVVAGS